MRAHRFRVALLEAGREPARHDGVDDRLGPGVEHGCGALAPEVGRRQMGRGAHQDEARGAPRMEDAEGLGDHAAERQADDMGLGDVEGLEQAGEVVREVVDGGRLVARAGAAVPLRVVAQQAEAAVERSNDAVPHLDGAAQRIGEGDGRQALGTDKFVEKVDAVDGDGRHIRASPVAV